MLQEGDRVKYVPSLDFARDRLPDGTFVYHHDAHDRRAKSRVVLDPKEVRKALEGRLLRHLSDVRPTVARVHWDAVVLTAHDDGTADLSVQGSVEGVTHGLRGVAVAAGRTDAPHTCYPA